MWLKRLILEINFQQYFPYNIDFLGLSLELSIINLCSAMYDRQKNQLANLNKDLWVMCPCPGRVFIFTYS